MRYGKGMNYILAIALLLSVSTAQLKTLQSSLDPSSISQLLAFYQLYPETEQGQKALSDAWKLMGQTNSAAIDFPQLDLQPLISLVNRQPLDQAPNLSAESLDLIDHISSHLHNRKLKGFYVWKKQDLFDLSSDEIDLARALLLYQFEDALSVRRYEATLDLMALQINARLKPSSTDEEKVRALNDFIFLEMRYRFPPHSIWSDDVDIYTFLPAVMDSRKGVCLGVSILYLSLAQRLNLPLEIITPPGHIYVRYKDKINIETTARGIHVPSKMYLGINTKTLHERTLKEVVGLAFINQAAVCWHRENYEEAVHLYEQALTYMPDDDLLKMFLGYNYLFTHQTAKGKDYLSQIAGKPMEGAVCAETIPQDYLDGKVDIEGIKAVFMSVDETRSSIEKKQIRLGKVLKRYPKFRDGWLHYAVTFLQLGRHEGGIEALEKYHALDPTNATIEYYLAQLKIMRFRPKDAWQHLHLAENITAAQNHYPDCLKQLRQSLRSIFPISE